MPDEKIDQKRPVDAEVVQAGGSLAGKLSSTASSTCRCWIGLGSFSASTGRFWSIFSSGIGTSINLHRAMASQEEWFRPGFLTGRAPGGGRDDFIGVCTSTIQGMRPKQRIR